MNLKTSSVGIVLVIIVVVMIAMFRGKGGPNVLVDTENGAEATMPKDWPSDVPMYKESALMFSSVQEGGGTMTVILQTRSSMSEVMEFYEEALPRSGWTVANVLTGVGGNILLSEKGTRTLSVTAAGEEGAVTISLAVSEG